MINNLNKDTIDSSNKNQEGGDTTDKGDTSEWKQNIERLSNMMLKDRNNFENMIRGL